MIGLVWSHSHSRQLAWEWSCAGCSQELCPCVCNLFLTISALFFFISHSTPRLAQVWRCKAEWADSTPRLAQVWRCKAEWADSAPRLAQVWRCKAEWADSTPRLAQVWRCKAEWADSTPRLAQVWGCKAEWADSAPRLAQVWRCKTEWAVISWQNGSCVICRLGKSNRWKKVCPYWQIETNKCLKTALKVK